MAKIIYIPNTFAEERYEHTIDVDNLSDAILEFLGVHPELRKPLSGNKSVVSINGKVLDREDWDAYSLKSDDIVEVTHAIAGGFFSALFGGGTPATTSDDRTEVYDWEGPSTSKKQNQPVGLIYGEHMVGGQYINYNIESDGNNNYLNMLIALGEGVITGILNEDKDALVTQRVDLTPVTTDSPYIKLNDQFATFYDEATWAMRSGTNTQSSIQGFRDVRTSRDYDYPLPAENSGGTAHWTIALTTSGPVDQATIKYVCPNGLIREYDSGKKKSEAVRHRIRYRVTSPQGNWIYYPSSGYKYISRKTKSKVVFKRTVTFAESNTYDIQTQRQSPGVEIRSSKKIVLNKCRTESITEIVSQNLSYPNTALLAMKVLATDQLSGSVPNVTTLVRGVKIRVPDLAGNGSVEFQDYFWTGEGNNFELIEGADSKTWDGVSYVTQWCSNPAYILRDFLLNDRYGFGEVMFAASVDDVSLDTAAKKCWQLVDGAHKNELHIVIDSVHTPGTIINKIARTGRLIVYWSSGYLKFKYEEDENPVQLFTMGNILKGKFSITYVRHSKIPNIIELNFANADDDYKTNSIEVVDEEEWALNKPKRKESIEFIGVTTVAQALREAKFALNKAKFSRRNIKFSTTIGAVQCEPGDVVAVQHDVPQWGWGGRVVSGTSTTFQIDQPMPDNIINDPTSYDAQVQHSDDSIETFDIASVSGKTVTVQGTFSTIPEEDTTYLLGVEDSTIKEYRVSEVTYAKNDTVQVSAVEHNAAIYSDTGLKISDDEASELPNPAAFSEPVTDLVLTELNTDLGFDISFKSPEEDYTWARADVYISENNDVFNKIAEGYGDDDLSYYNVRPGQKYYIKVYSVNKMGIRSRTAVSDEITIKGDTVGNPQSPTGLEIETQGNNTVFGGRDCKFAWRINAPFGGAGSLEPTLPAGIAGQSWAIVRDFKLELWDSSQTTLLREEYTTDKFYTYTWEKNAEDNSGSPKRTFVLKVYQRNWYSKISLQPAILSVSNPAPSMVTHTPTLTNAFDGLFVDWSGYTTVDTDMANYKMYYGTATPLTASVAQISKSTKGAALTGLVTTQLYYIQLEPYDLFGVGTKSQVASGIPRELTNIDIGASIIAASNLAASSVTKESLKTDIIGPEYIEASAVKIEHLRTNIIDTNYIVASAIGTVHLKAGLIETNYIAASAITADLLRARLISTSYLAASAVDTDNLKANIIKAAYIDGTDFGTLTITSGQVNINAKDGFVVNTASGMVLASSGSLHIEGGGDIWMSGNSLNPSRIRIDTGTEGTVILEGTDTEFQQGVRFFPQTGGTSRFIVGEPEKFSEIQLAASIACEIIAKETTLYQSRLFLSAGISPTLNNWIIECKGGGSNSTYLKGHVQDATYGNNIEMRGGIWPTADSSYMLGSINKCFSMVYRDASSTCSDKKFKDDIVVEPLGLDFVNALQPVEFTWNKGKPNAMEKWQGKKFRGILAQDVEAVLEECGYEASTFAGVLKHKQKDADGVPTGVWNYAFNYEQLISPMIKAIQELNEKVENLEKE